MGDDQGDKELRALCKLFIGGIPRSISDEELAEAFLQFTNDDSLNDCVVIKDEMKNSRGFGFVTYHNLADTDNCLANRPHILGGKEVEVKHAIPRDEQNATNHTRTNKIFVGGLPLEANEEDVKQAVENYTLSVGESLNVKIDKVDIIMKDGKPRGFCFVEMGSEDDADKVVIVKYFNIKGKRVELKKAEPKGPSSGGMGGRGGRGGRGSNRGGGGRMSSFGGGGGGGGSWGGSGYGGGYNQMYGGGDGNYGGYGSYSTGVFGGGNPYGEQAAYYNQTQSAYGPTRSLNGARYGGSGRGRGGYRPY